MITNHQLLKTPQSPYVSTLDPLQKYELDIKEEYVRLGTNGMVFIYENPFSGIKPNIGLVFQFNNPNYLYRDEAGTHNFIFRKPEFINIIQNIKGDALITLVHYDSSNDLAGMELGIFGSYECMSSFILEGKDIYSKFKKDKSTTYLLRNKKIYRGALLGELNSLYLTIAEVTDFSLRKTYYNEMTKLSNMEIDDELTICLWKSFSILKLTESFFLYKEI